MDVEQRSNEVFFAGPCEAAFGRYAKVRNIFGCQCDTLFRAFNTVCRVN